jgi:hypothetical protein
LKGEPHDIRPGTGGMGKAQIARKLVEQDPVLLLPENKIKLCDPIEPPIVANAPSSSALVVRN